MTKPRIFLGSSTGQAKLLEQVAAGLDGVADAELWMTTFNPGTTTLDRLIELTREVDFAAFVFAQDDWTAVNAAAAPPPGAGQASPRDNVVFEAGLFGGVLGLRRTFILHASGAKLPTDLLGLTCVRYDGAITDDGTRTICEKLARAIEAEGRIARVEGQWWQYSLTARTEYEPSAISLLSFARGRDGALELTGRAWQADGTLSSRYWSEAIRERRDPSGAFYYWKGERPLHPDAPQLYGTGEVRLETADRASGYFTTLSEAQRDLNARTSGTYLRADPADIAVMEGGDARRRAALIAERLGDWQAIRNA